MNTIFIRKDKNKKIPEFGKNQQLLSSVPLKHGTPKAVRNQKYNEKTLRIKKKTILENNYFMKQ